MRFVSYIAGRRPRAAVLTPDNTVLPIAELVPGGPEEMLDVIEGGSGLWDRIREAAGRGSASGGQPLSSVQLAAPIPKPRRNVLCVGWNYQEHFAEGQGFRGPNDDIKEIPPYPALFSKQPNTVIGPEAPIWHPAPISEQLDWEVELAVIIGTPGRDIPEEAALRHVFGYTIGNDVSVRDVQRRHGGQWFKGKNFDTHCPLGPWIVTPDEIGDPQNLRITLRVNGVTKQDSSTKFMVYKLPRIIKEFSTGALLEPGDVILTGTPDGVGFARKPPEFMKVGDTVEAEIEKIGVLRNPIAEYQSGAAGQPAAAGAKAAVSAD
jgi:2-keto-4-pentenoate hydratase/2-oxohepta-3-ene-1,7-dioic acid hydratase in catechol pathway